MEGGNALFQSFPRSWFWKDSPNFRYFDTLRHFDALRYFWLILALCGPPLTLLLDNLNILRIFHLISSHYISPYYMFSHNWDCLLTLVWISTICPSQFHALAEGNWPSLGAQAATQAVPENTCRRISRLSAGSVAGNHSYFSLFFLHFFCRIEEKKVWVLCNPLKLYPRQGTLFLMSS